MSSPLNKPWFVAGLGLTAVVLVARALLPTDAADRAPDPAELPFAANDPAAGVATVPSLPSPAMIEEALRLLGATPGPLRDPFTPQTAAVLPSAAPAPDFEETIRLSAVWVQGAGAYGVVNDRIHAAGDTIGRITIDGITADGIWLSHWRGREFLAVGDSFTLFTPAGGPAANAAVLARHEG